MQSQQSQQAAQILSAVMEAYKPVYAPVDLDKLFASTPDGDFHYIADEAGDWHIENHGKDSMGGMLWYTKAYAVNMARSNGKRWVEVRAIDQDGEWFGPATVTWMEGAYEWEQVEPQFRPYISSPQEDLNKGWAKYYLWCATSYDDATGAMLGDADIFQADSEAIDCSKAVQAAIACMNTLDCDAMTAAIKASGLSSEDRQIACNLLDNTID